MKIFFGDTSGIIKRYLIEIGSTWTHSWIEPAAGNMIIISDLTPIEVFSVLARRQREQTLTPANAILLQRDFLAHVKQEYFAVPLEESVLIRARDLVTKYFLRPPDAIQLASAIHAANILGEPITFICADKDLLNAAAGEGFVTDNPNLHP